jgi:hypothetical protein
LYGSPPVTGSFREETRQPSKEYAYELEGLPSPSGTDRGT